MPSPTRAAAVSFFTTACRLSDHTGVAALLDDMPSAQWLLGDRGYNADCFAACFPLPHGGFYF